MLSLPPSTRILLCTEVTDMRRGFDGLAGMTREVLAADPLSGHLFVFRNRRGDRMKILYWDRDGSASVEVDHAMLTLILEGIDVRDARRQRRYHRSA